MPTVVIAFAGQKGGSGKTTAALAVAAEWHARGRRVLLVDADAEQGSARTWGAIATEAGRGAPTVIAMGAGMHRADQLPALAAGYDVVVIDCPPRHGDVQRSALMVADLVVLPCGPSAVDAWVLTESVEQVNGSRTLRPELRAVVLITRKVARTAIGAGARETLAQFGLPVLAAELGARVTYQEAPAAGQGVTVYAPASPAADEVRVLVSELESLIPRKRKEPRHAVEA